RRPAGGLAEALRAPLRAVPAIVAALALSFAPGATGGLALAAAGALGIVFVAAGAARVHLLARRTPLRPAALSAYWAAFVVLFPWIAILTALLGAADAVFGARRRVPAAAVDSPPDSQSKPDGEEPWK
ncbi:MAG: hypothetical protein KGI57_06720, partial [Hyphomicrobiales bacterium]|nr:hypothetical protein [Hyphomicrobiales bacterium]